MARHSGPVLVDTNIIIECHRAGAWAALAGGYRVETVGKCLEEALTVPRRRPHQPIDGAALVKSLKAIHEVTDALRIAATLRDPLYGKLDAGEQHLWAHALVREDGWVLCGPDKASLRFGVGCGYRDKLISLERLLKEAGTKPRGLKPAYTAKWLDQTLAEIVMQERGRR